MRASLVAETVRPAAGATVTLALLMQPEKGWHGYWENPGDAGAGMSLDWQLPKGARVGALRYPVPERLVIAGLMNHVYEHDYAVLVDLTLPAGLAAGTKVPVRVEGRWLVCTDSLCVPEQGSMAIDLIMGDGRIDPADRARFDGWRAVLPRPLDQRATYRASGEGIAIAVPYPATATVGAPWFYALSHDRIAYAEPQRVRRVGDRLVIETKQAKGAASGGPVEGVLSVAPGLALVVSAVPGAVPAGGETIGQGAGGAFSGAALLLALGGAFLGGLILNVMPCVFPILSLKALSLAKAGGSERQARRDALAYGAGILLTCLALGGLMLAIRAGGAQIGWAFQLQQPGVIALLLVLMVAITLNLAGLFELAVIGSGQGQAGQGGTAGSFWTGVLAAFVATPCTGPFMGAAMGAALVLPWPLALLVFAGLALGLAAPFIAIAFVPALRRRLPRPGAWMNRLKHILAIPMGLTALGLLWLLWRQTGSAGLALGIGLALLTALLLWLLGGRQRRGLGTSGIAIALALLGLSGVAIAAPGLIGTRPDRAVAHDNDVPFSAAALAQRRQGGTPVFLYFTADWCLTCKVNEAGALNDRTVNGLFRKAGVIRMVGDWTNADPAISRFLEANGRSGVPLYLYYAPGAAQPQVLPQILTPTMLTALVNP
jgi:thiol:disulfide interchange protein